MNTRQILIGILPLILISQTAVAVEGKTVESPTARVSQSVLVDFLMGDLKQAPDADSRRSSLQQELALQDAILGEANRSGLTEQQNVQAAIELARRRTIVRAYWTDFFQRNPIPESAIRDAYANLAKLNGTRQYLLSRILVKDEATSRKVLDELKGKRSFSTVAKNRSLDEGTRQKGGDLGWRWKSEISPIVREALEKAKPGDLIGPLKPSPELFLFVKLEEQREQTMPEFEKLKPELEKGLRQRAEQAELNRLRTPPK